MKILYLSYDGLSDPLGRSQILPYIIGLSKKDYQFTIISFEKQNAFDREHDEIKFICEQAKIDWIPLPYHKQPPILSTVYDIWQLWRAIKKEYGHKQFQVIHCRSYITSLVGLKAKQKWGVKFIFDMRGFWADERVEGGLWNLKNPIFRLVYNFFKRKEKQFLIASDHVISLTYNAKNEIESWNIGNAPITVIPTCVDLDLFDPLKIKKEWQTALKNKLGISSDNFVLLYLGSWGTWYLTSEMMTFFSRLKQKKPNSKFLIVSNDEIDIDNHPFKEDIIIASSSRKEVPLYTSLASAAICFIKPSFSKKASSATKMGELLAMNILLITNEGWGDVKDFEKEGALLVTKLVDENFDTLIENKLHNNHNVIHPKLNQLSLSTGIESYAYIYRQIGTGLHPEFKAD